MQKLKQLLKYGAYILAGIKALEYFIEQVELFEKGTKFKDVTPIKNNQNVENIVEE